MSLAARHGWRRTPVCLVSLCVLATGAGSGTAQAASVAAELAMHSEMLRRGVSLTDDIPALAASVDVDFDNGVFAGATGYYADTRASEFRQPQRAQVAVGWFQELGPHQALGLSVTGSRFSRIDDWDYIEFALDWHVRPDFSLGVRYAGNDLGRGIANASLLASHRLDIAPSWYLASTAGVGRLGDDSAATTYFGQLALGYQSGRLNCDLSASLIDHHSAGYFRSDRTTVSGSCRWRLY